MTRFLIPVLLILLASDSLSQKLLFHKNKYKEQAYQIGDVISFRLAGERTKITGQILGFEDSVIVFQDFKINPKNISWIYVDKKTKTWFFLRYKYQYLLPVIGGGYFLLQLVNAGKADQDIIPFSASMIGAGLLAKIFMPIRFKIKGKRKLLIMNKLAPNR